MTTTLSTQQLTLQRDKLICRDVSINFQAGERWALLGANGSGKSTLLHHLAGLDTPASGTITLNSTPLQDFKARHIARHIGILLQDSHFPFPQTVYEYCLTGRFPHRPALRLQEYNSDDVAIVDATIAQMQIHHLASKNVQQLSGGERRRVAITALFIQNPDILLLDEPVNHLDLHQQIMLLQTISAKALEGHTIVMSLHDVNLAQQYCDKCLMLFADGSSIHGNIDQILTQTNLECLFQHPMQRIIAEGKKYWLPQS